MAGAETFELRAGGTGNTDDFVEFAFGLGFEQEGDDDDGDGAIFASPSFNLDPPLFPDTGVEDGFEALTGGGIGKDEFGELIPFEFALGGDEFRAEFPLDFLQGGLAGLDEFPGKDIGTYDFGAGLQKKTGGGGFSHANAAGQTAEFHQTKGGRLRSLKRPSWDPRRPDKSPGHHCFLKARSTFA